MPLHCYVKFLKDILYDPTVFLDECTSMAIPAELQQ